MGLARWGNWGESPFDATWQDRHLLIKIPSDPANQVIALIQMLLSARWVPVPGITVIDAGRMDAGPMGLLGTAPPRFPSPKLELSPGQFPSSPSINIYKYFKTTIAQYLVYLSKGSFGLWSGNVGNVPLLIQGILQMWIFKTWNIFGSSTAKWKEKPPSNNFHKSPRFREAKNICFLNSTTESFRRG